MRIGSWIIFIIAVITEGTLTSLPLVLIFLLCLMVMKKADWIFALALVSGIILDIFTIRAVGTTSVLLILFVFLILLYERKYEIATIPFVAGASLIGSFIYLTILGNTSLIESITSSIFAVLVFVIYSWFRRPVLPSHLDYQKV